MGENYTYYPADTSGRLIIEWNRNTIAFILHPALLAFSAVSLSLSLHLYVVVNWSIELGIT